MAAQELFTCDFEIFGRVQRVHFRKCTRQQAIRLCLRGWCMNTIKGTVIGSLEGPQDKLSEMKYWLRNQGSPKSRITNANFSEMKPIAAYTFPSFVIKR